MLTGLNYLLFSFSLSGCPRVSVEAKKELMRREVEIKLACGDTGTEVGPKPIKMHSGQRKCECDI